MAQAIEQDEPGGFGDALKSAREGGFAFERKDGGAPRWAWAPIPLLLLAMLSLFAADFRSSFDPPWLLFLLNFTFTTAASAWIVLLISRSFLASGAGRLLLLNCGVALWGLAGVTAISVGGADFNASMTIHNVCCWLSGLCHLAGVSLASGHWQRLEKKGWWLLAGFFGTALVVALVAWAAVTGRMPIFFVQGKGGTQVRYWVLGSESVMFTISAMVLWIAHRDRRSAFADWYALALLLIATGALGLMFESTHGSALGWTARGTGWLSAVYMGIAALVAAREYRAREVSLVALPSEAGLRYALAVAFVAAAVAARLLFLHSLHTNVAFLLCYPPVILAALYCGRGPGLLAAVLAAVSADYLWIEPLGQLTMRTGGDWLSLGVFLGTSALLVWVAGAMQQERARANAAETQMKVLAERRLADEALRKTEERARNELEQKVEERTVKLRVANAELEAFSYSLSHDFRAPLRAIRGYAQLVVEEAGESIGPHAANLNRVIRASERMDRMMSGLLAFCRISRDAVALETLDADKLVRAIIQERPELQLPRAKVEIPATLPLVLGHEASLTQCVTNLLGNAVKFMANGNMPEIRIISEATGSKVRLWFEDNGIGIAKKNQEKIFEMFQREHTKYEGSGIGLAIVRRAVERMGGKAGVESEAGKGSRFWIELERAEGGAGATHPTD